MSNREWDAIASEFEDITYDQTAAYSSARWGQARNSHLLLRDGGNVVAGARVVLLTLPLVHSGLAYVKFGPFWRRRGANPDGENLRAILDALVREYCERRGLLLTIQPRPNPEFGAVEQSALRERGFTVRRTCHDAERYMVNLALDEEAQYSSLGQKWRANLRKALASELDIRSVDGAAGLDDFASLHGEMVARKRASSGDAIDLVPALQRRLPPPLAPKIVLAYRNGTPLAGAVIAALGDTAYYVFGASSRDALKHRAGFALQWWIVRWLSGAGARWYDLGGTAGDPGLRQFKCGLVGRHGAVAHMPDEHDLWHRAGHRVAADVVFALRAVMQKTAGLSAVGVWK